ncbi:hypothetical protein M433DRAFT_7494 [Acidomyces richmondensis BFW]|nr:hypothetical protein M433DRAFT_7494 [Acidomyces richmondensis BFW]
MPSPDTLSSETNSLSSSPILGSPNVSQMPASTYTSSNSKWAQSGPRSPSMSPIPEHGSHLSPDNHSRHQMSSDEDRLYDVNHEIKSTLTDLLNCDAIRHNSRMRMWVQARLMEAERELKRQKKRRLSAPTIVVTSGEDE